jgi:hypothetical protein
MPGHRLLSSCAELLSGTSFDFLLVVHHKTVEDGGVEFLNDALASDAARNRILTANCLAWIIAVSPRDYCAHIDHCAKRERPCLGPKVFCDRSRMFGQLCPHVYSNHTNSHGKK